MASEKWRVKAGDFLFRWRSYTPLVLFPLYYFGYGQSVLIPHLPGAEAVYFGLAGALVVLGQLGRILTVGFIGRGTSGRNTRGGQVAEQLNTQGAYSIVRNPLYFANFLMFMGVILTGLSEWLVVVNAAVFLLVYRAIIAAEEGFLAQKFGQDYAAYRKSVPRFWPGAGLWRAPQRRFSPAMVARREHDTIMAALLTFAMAIHAGGYIETGSFRWFPGWLAAVGVAAVPYSIVKLLSRYTRVLHPPE